MDEQAPDNRIPIAPGVLLAESMLRFTFSRSGGPGGQNVNKLSTKATLTIQIEDLAPALPLWALKRLLIHAGNKLAGEGDRIIITDSSSRSQQANKQACLAKLRLMVVEAMNRPKRRRPTKPSRGSILRRLDAKRQRSQRKTERREPSDQ
jgi:ribosome-associated protein